MSVHMDLPWMSIRSLFSPWSPCLFSIFLSCPPPSSLPCWGLGVILAYQTRLRPWGWCFWPHASGHGSLESTRLRKGKIHIRERVRKPPAGMHSFSSDMSWSVGCSGLWDEVVRKPRSSFLGTLSAEGAQNLLSMGTFILELCGVVILCIYWGVCSHQTLQFFVTS